MVLHLRSFLLLLFSFTLTTCLKSRDYDAYDYYALHLDPSQNPEDVAKYFNLEFDGQLGQLDDHYMFKSLRHDVDLVQDAMQEHNMRKRKRELGYDNVLLDNVLLHQKQKLKPPMVKRAPIPQVFKHLARQNNVTGSMPYPTADPSVGQNTDHEKALARGREIAKELDITDPIYNDQWHLYNPVQIGHDINVTGVWLQGITGKGTYVCIIDDGLDMDSEDIKDNYFAAGSYDFNDKSKEPRPRLDDDRHGTRCAGEVAAVKNNVCGVGVAYEAKVAGIRILSKPITDADEAEAMIYGFQKTQIYSCSWGPPDDGTKMGAPGILIRRAMLKAIQRGRNGLGTIYVFAAGNGASQDDNCNFDGYTNSIYSITVGAIDREGHHPYYSEKCSAQLVVTYSSGSGDAIHTTDVGVNECYTGHGGTSAAGPLAAGIFALVLEARPTLSWRDLQWLSVLTAIPVHEANERPNEWQNTSIGKPFSHQYGFGKLDAWAIVEAAKNFTARKPQAWYFSPWQHIHHKIPEGQKGLVSTLDVSKVDLNTANLEVIEHVTVTMNINHTRRGDLSVDLKSPTGMISHLSTARRRDNERAGYIDWTFMSVAHWGESGEGRWTIIVKDVNKNEYNGTFIDWKLNLFGECINPTHQPLLPMPTVHDDDDHDREGGDVETTSVELPIQTGAPLANPTDHIHRPVNAKPSDAFADSYTPVPQASTKPAPPMNTENQPHPTSTSEPPAPPGTIPVTDDKNSHSDSFLPSPFPTFGVSKRTQVWIYGAGTLILIFCLSLAIYFFLARRKRLRHLARENYEFEILQDQDDDEGGGYGGKVGGRRGKRRAGELYDAFAGESEEEMFSDEEKYQDAKDDDLDEKARKRE